MWKSVVVCSALVAGISGFSITGPGVSQCIANQSDLPLSAGVEGCAGAPCAIPQHEDGVFNIIFRTPRDISTLTTVATAYFSVAGIVLPVPYDLAEQSVTCNYLLNSSCPLQEGNISLYTLRLNFYDILPVGTQIAMELRIQDEKWDNVACIRVPIVIEAPRLQFAGLKQ